jgi:ribosome-binding factor A
MNETKQKKWESIVQKTASSFIQEHADPSSLITVTRVDMNSRGKTATILLSVLPESREEPAIAFMKRHERDIRHILLKQYPGFVPYIECTLDKGERHRQHIDELFNQL